MKKFLKDNTLLMKEYLYEKNAEYDLNNITEGMSISLWWKCSKCNFEWKTRLSHRTKDGTGCPECRKKESIEKNKIKTIERLKKENITITYPNIAKEWNYEKNINILPENYLPGMNEVVWWKCSNCNYEWKTRINHRTKDGNNCPKCSKEKVYSSLLKEKGSLSQNNPELLKEWDYNRNISIDPNKILSGCNKSAWWKCSKCGNTWKASIANRSKGTGCPKCGQKKGKETLINNLINIKGSLLETNPELSKEFHPTKNGNLSPNNVMEKSPKKVWWKCSKCNYEWEMSLYNRSKGGYCPKCLAIEKSLAKATPILGVNDLLSQNPVLSNEWHPTKNGDLKPENITISSNKKIWWLGKCGHEWQATVGSRSTGRGCPICLKEYKISYPEKIIYFYLNKTLEKYEVKENLKIDFLNGKEFDIAIPKLKIAIEYDGYNWHKKVDKDLEKDKISFKNEYTLIRIRESKCQKYESSSVKIYYDEKKQKNLKDVLMQILYIISNITKEKYTLDFDIDRDNIDILELLEMNKKENSIYNLYPEVLSEWHPSKNGNLKPEYISAHTHKKMWWICPKGHEYQMVVKHKTEDSCKCPICSSHRVLTGYNDLKTLAPEIAKEWDYQKNKGLKPDDVMRTSNRKVWWICPKGHSYEYSISHRTYSGRTCPICSNRKLLIGFNDLKTINMDIAKEWNYEKNGNLKPENFTPISGKRVWWKCSKCNHEWSIKISNRYVKSNGCPKCAGKKRWETRNNLK